MIARLWHGWTTPENADAYERLLKHTIFPRIAAKGVPGYVPPEARAVLARFDERSQHFELREELSN